MANGSVRAKMPPADRAKQFAPFSALHGLDEALARKRHELCFVPKKELVPDERYRVDALISNLTKGQKVCLTYYDNGEYITAEDIITGIDLQLKRLIFGTDKIDFDDISDVIY